ncbi:MAG: dihydroorotate dehydrogenase-like protein [Candidatus Aminicenantes bacterium]|nr:MAG: dihydroorotate dehydrogenase-like protein [Candidatus Aminicenantes bacterium]
MADLTTSYMGLQLRNPIIVSSSDLTKSISSITRCYEAGAGAVVLKSIFEEQFLEEGGVGREGYTIHPEARDYLQSGALLDYAPQKIYQVIEGAKKETSIPIIASINCQSPKLWPRFARQFQDAGADGLELNIYFLPLDLDSPGSEYEEFHLQIMSEVKRAVSIPVSVKLISQLTSISYLVSKLANAGCDGAVLFNWFLEPDINIENLKTRDIIGKGNFRQSLKWAALLAGRVGCDIASSGGVRTADDVIKLILAGASAVQACSLFYQQGLEALKELLKGLEEWMDSHRYLKIGDFRGELSYKRQELSFKGVGEAGAYFRAQYLKTYSKIE